MQKAGTRQWTRTLLPVALLASGVVGMSSGCKSKWDSTPGPYTSGDQAASYTRVPSGGRTENDGMGPTTRPYDSGTAAIAPTAPKPDSPAVVAPASGGGTPTTNPALVPATTQTRPTGREITPRVPARDPSGYPDIGSPAINPPTPATQPAAAPAAETKVVTGTLESGQVGIGGETTGWRLLTDDTPPKSVEVDVAAVRDQAKKLDGKRVRVVGVYTTRQFVERGNVTVFSARRIEAAPPGGANK
jgi:hypothetical protein